MQEQLPQLAALAESYIALPVSSADVEHSFSVASSSKHVDGQFACSLLSILR